MNRLPWHRASPYGGLGEGGSVERLETDVMRFMAILAFCLMAIFALVQSLSVSETEPALQVQSTPKVSTRLPPPPPVTSPAKKKIEIPAPSAPVRESVEAPPPASPVSQAPVSRTPVTVAITEPPTPEVLNTQVTPPSEGAALQRQVSAAPSPESARQTPAPTQRGFSLRFESDSALTQLVRRGEVDLYAFTGSDAWQLMLVEGRVTFRTSQEPRQFHEMAASTVPEGVVTSFRRAVIASLKPLTWGVTLPPSTSVQLTRLMAVNDGGELVIDARGQLRLNRW